MFVLSLNKGNAAFAKARRLSHAFARYVTRSLSGVARTVLSLGKPLYELSLDVHSRAALTCRCGIRQVVRLPSTLYRRS